MERLAAHRKQLFSLLPAGMAFHHLANPAASLMVEKLYCLPVLLSGLATLVLTKSEESMINRYHKNTLRMLMKLPSNTPDAAVYFLAGSLPAAAYLHQKQLTLFNMICHLEENLLKKHAIDILTKHKQTSAKSWFHHIVTLSQKYDLPHPLLLLNDPEPKFKKIVSEKIHEVSRHALTEACSVESLQFLNTPFLSLRKPHPIWTSLDGNPYQAKAAFVQAAFLSGKYRTEKVSRFWSQNKDGICLQKECVDLKILEDNKHVLLHCSALNEKRRRLFDQYSVMIVSNPILKPIADFYLMNSDENVRLQFLFDCSTLPMVIQAFQVFGKPVHEFLFKLSRSWCRSLHKERLKLLGRPCP